MSGSSPRRRTLEELRTLYLLNPTFRDLLVEGRTDARFFKWYLREVGVRGAVQIYAVDDRVEIPGELVDAAGASRGPRGRLIALATRAASWAVGTGGLTAVIDADRARVVERESLPPFSGLLLTDYGSLDVYAFQPRPLQQFFDVVVGVVANSDSVISELTPLLHDVFACRAALHETNVSMIATFPALCGTQLAGGGVNRRQIIERSVNAAGRSSERDEVLERVDALRALIATVDPLAAIRGHDIAPLLVRWLGLRNEWANPQTVEEAMRGTLNVGDLVEKPLFVEIERRLT